MNETLLGMAERSGMGDESGSIYWSRFIDGEVCWWFGYDTKYWWENVARTDQSMIREHHGQRYRLDPETDEIFILDAPAKPAPPESLASCPFCGNMEAYVYNVGHSHGDPEYAVRCDKCWIVGPDDLERSVAVAKWNRRAPLVAERLRLQTDTPNVTPCKPTHSDSGNQTTHNG